MPSTCAKASALAASAEGLVFGTKGVASVLHVSAFGWRGPLIESVMVACPPVRHHRCERELPVTSSDSASESCDAFYSTVPQVQGSLGSGGSGLMPFKPTANKRKVRGGSRSVR